MSKFNSIKFIRLFLSLYIAITLLHIYQAKIIFLKNYPSWQLLNLIDLSNPISFHVVFLATLISTLLLGLSFLPNFFSFLTYIGLFLFFTYNQYIFEVHYFYLNWLLIALTLYTKKNEKLFFTSTWLVFIFSMGLLGLAKLNYNHHYFTPQVAKYLLDLNSNRMHFTGILSPISTYLSKELPDYLLTLISLLGGILEFLILPLGLFNKTKKAALLIGLVVFLFIGGLMNYINISIFMIFFMFVGFCHNEH